MGMCTCIWRLHSRGMCIHVCLEDARLWIYGSLIIKHIITSVNFSYFTSLNSDSDAGCPVVLYTYSLSWSYVAGLWAYDLKPSKSRNCYLCLCGFFFAAVLLAVACAVFIVRLVLVIWRHFKQPLYTRTSSKSTFPLA